MKQQKWFILILVISLILNIFMAGVLLGRHLFHQPPHEDKHVPAAVMRPPHPKHFFWMLRELPEETRQKVEPIVQQQFQRGQIRAEIHQTRRLFHEMEDLFISDPLNKDAIQQQFQMLQDRRNQMAKRLNDGLLLIADQLSPREREQLMRAIRHSRPFRDKHHRGERHHDRHEPKHHREACVD